MFYWLFRAAKEGKVDKAAALPGFFKIECGGKARLAAVTLVPYLPKIYWGGPTLSLWGLLFWKYLFKSAFF